MQKKSYVSAQASYNEELAKESERNEVKEQLLTLHNLLPTVSGLTAQRQVLESLKNTVDQVEKSLLVNQQSSTQQKESIIVQKNEIKELETSLEEYEQLLDQLAISKAIAKLVASYSQQLAQRQELEAQYETAKQQVGHYTDAYQALENRWISNQAVVLAASLHDGESCPVCGSIDHPAKAGGVEAEHVSKQQIDTAKLELTNKEQIFHTKQAELQQVQQRIELIEAELKEHQVDLHRDYQKEHVELTEKVAVLRNKRELLKQKKDKINEAEKSMEELTEEMKKLELQRNESKGELETKRALYNYALTKIPENLQELSALQQQIASKETTSQKLESAWKAVQQNLQDASTEETKWEST